MSRFTPFGQLMTLDIKKVPSNKLDTQKKIYDFLASFPARIGMRVAVDPVVKYIKNDTDKDKGGFSGFVILYESHISIHTFPHKNFITIDIYSCKEFFFIDLLNNLHDELNVTTQDIDWNLVPRGKNFNLI